MDTESKSQEILSGDRPVPVYVVPYADRDDEISLIGLWHVIVVRKMVILLSFLAAMLLASVYVYWAEPLYRAEVELLPPQQKDIQGLIDYRGKEGLEIEQYTPNIVYKAFLKNLKSSGLRRDFFDTHDLIDHYFADKPHTDADIDRIFDEKFNVSLQIQADKQDVSFVTVKFADSDPVLAAQWLNQFVVLANERTIQQLFSDINAVIQAEIEWVKHQLASKLKLAAQRRYDIIISLREALRVAKALGIESAGSHPVAANKEKSSIEVNTAQVPLYMRGTKALEVEIAVLESRKSDEPFIAGLRDLKEKLVFLEEISIDRNKLSAVTIAAAARIPYQAEKPSKKLIFMLAAVFGLMAGVFLLFIAEFWSKARAQSNQHAA